MFFLAAFLDALSTYAVVATGRGVETNPMFADVINSNPAVAFSLVAASATTPSAMLYVAVWLSNKLSPPMRARVIRAAAAAFTAAVLIRAAVAVSNLALISA
jgi:hypothetical protein